MAIKEILPPGSGAGAVKHRDLVQRELGADLVLLLLDRAPNAIRRQMVDHEIGFIASGAQLYVPEAFLDLRERAPAFAIASAASVLTTQFLLLAIMQGRSLERSQTSTELAERSEEASGHEHRPGPG